MRVFLTGATGFIGSRIMSELMARGHQVIGLTRSQSGVQALKSLGADAHIGTLEDLSSIRAGTEKADAVIHTAFDHNFDHFVENCQKDKHVIEALGASLKGSNRPLIITSGVGMGSLGSGQMAREDIFNVNYHNPRIASEIAGNTALESGVDVRVVRLPQVHNTEKQGLISPLIAIAKEKGVAAYVGDGEHSWSAGHLDDVAKLYCLVLEKGQKGKRYNAVSEEGVTVKEIAKAIGTGLNIPVTSIPAGEAAQYFGWLVLFANSDMSASSAITQQELGWKPRGPNLIEDLTNMDYSK